MHDAVGADEVGRDDVGAVDGDLATGNVDRGGLTVDRRDAPGRNVGGHDFGGHDVIGKNGDELGPVFGLEQGLDGAGRKGGEGGVGRRKNSERSGAREGFDEPGGRYGGNECGVVGLADGNIDDGLGFATVVVGESRAGKAEGNEGDKQMTEFHDGYMQFSVTGTRHLAACSDSATGVGRRMLSGATCKRSC